MNLLTDSISPEHADRTYKTIGYFIAFIAVGLMAAALGPTLLDLSKQTRTEWDEIAILFTVHALGYFIGSLLGGRLYDRMPGHRVMVGGLITMAIMILASIPALILPQWREDVKKQVSAYGASPQEPD